MWDNHPELTTRLRRESAIRHFSGAVLCALLLFFWTNARLARYETYQPTLKAASTQAYLDSEEIRRDLSKVTPLVSLAGVIPVARLILEKAILVPLVLSGLPPFNGFNPEFCLRPPPAR